MILASVIAFGINGFAQCISKTGNTVPNAGTNYFVYEQ
jgi:hypothetical protein